MKSPALITYISVSILVGTLSACGPNSTNGTSTGNPMTSTSLVVTGSGQAAQVASTWRDRVRDFFLPAAMALPPPSLTDSGSRTVLLSEAWLALSEIELRVDQSDNGNSSRGSTIGSTDTYFINLLSSNPDPIETPQLEKQTYRRIRMKVTKDGTPPVGAPAGLQGNGFYLEGTVNGVAFSVALDESIVFEVKGAKGITPDASHNLLLVVRLADLFKRINLGAISSPVAINSSTRVASANPCPQIDPSASDIYTCFKKGLDKNSKLGRDLDGNRDLDNQDDQVE